MAERVGELTSLIKACYAGVSSLSEARRLSATVLCKPNGTDGSPGSRGTDDGSPVTDRLTIFHEEVLERTTLLSGSSQKHDVVAAKKWLRARVGGKAVASRVGRMSTTRNSSAHPDVGVLRAIEAVAAAPLL